jgi:hypothetical protein
MGAGWQLHSREKPSCDLLKPFIIALSVAVSVPSYFAWEGLLQVCQVASAFCCLCAAAVGAAAAAACRLLLRANHVGTYIAVLTRRQPGVQQNQFTRLPEPWQC